ncbi:ABC transporter permease [Pseudonocardia pini]|uniref:ABC transporter permease n=1 Tax=Pseudonocardia pini TaxID=2758030 RepID=UPI0015F0F584|nr:ABC transporter permease [Pseudonocardia pini]
MTTLALADSRTMLRRGVRRFVRYPSLTVMLIGLPVVFLLLFVYVLGGTLGDGLSGGGRSAYLAYVVPGILMLTIASTGQGTAISVAMDMQEGIIARFRTMAIHQPAVLVGHVGATVIQTAVALAVVLGVAVAMGYRPEAGPLGWLGAVGLVLLATLAVTWLSVALGLGAKSVESASNSPMILTLLPFLGSGFVPTDSMPTALRWFAEYQPFTPIIETLRALLDGRAPASLSLWLALGWCVLVGVGSYVRSTRLYTRSR